MQDKIIAEIAAYLENADWSWRLPSNYTSQKIAAEIAAVIAPLVEVNNDWENAPPWANWKTVDIDSTVTFHENKPEHGQHTNRWKSTGGKTLTKGIKCINWKKEIYERHK